MVKQPVKNSCHDDWIMEQLCPVSKSLIGRDDGAIFLVSVCNKTEEQIALLPGDGCISHLIYYHQGGFIVASAFTGFARLMILFQFEDQMREITIIQGEGITIN